MAVNTGFLKGPIGILRILTIVIGVVTLGLVADQYAKQAKEEFLLSMIIILFILSLVWTVAFVMELIQASENTKKIDTWGHLIGGLLLLIAAIVWFVSVMEYHNNKVAQDLCRLITGQNCPLPVQRIIAGILSLINGLFYLVIGGLLFKA